MVTKQIKKPIALLLAVLMIFSAFIPTNVAVVEAANGDAAYDAVWPMTGATYWVYDTKAHADAALNSAKNGENIPTTGRIKTTSGSWAVLTIQKSGTEYYSNVVEVDVPVGNKYWVAEVVAPKGWNFDSQSREVTVVPGGDASTTALGLVISKDTPDFFKFKPSKDISISGTAVKADGTPLDTKNEYLQKFPIAGAKYALFTQSDAQKVLDYINNNQDNQNYPKTVNLSSLGVTVLKDETNQDAIFTVVDNTGKMSPEFRWLKEDKTYYMVEIERPYGYYFDNNMYKINGSGNTVTEKKSTEKPADAWLRINKTATSNIVDLMEEVPSQYGLEVTWAIYKNAGTYNNPILGALVAQGITDRTTGEMIWDEVYPKDNKPAVKVLPGEYVLKELGVGQDTGLTYSANITPVTVEDSDINKVKKAEFNDNTYDPPFTLTITKTLHENDEQYFKEMYSVQGTQFTVYYFDDDDLTENDLLTYDSEGRKIIKENMKSQAMRKWVLEAKDPDTYENMTLADGSNGIRAWSRIDMEDEYKVSGDDFFISDFGDPHMPIGTYVFEETKTTRGLAACDSWLWNMYNNKTNAVIQFSDYVKYPEELSVAANRRQTITIEIKKSSNNSDKPNYYGSLSGAEFLLEFYDHTESKWIPATAMDIPTNQSSDASKLVTNDQGVATSLPMKSGTYRLTEVKAPQGHTLNEINGDGTASGNSITFEVMTSTQNNGQRNFEFIYDAEYTDKLSNKSTVNFINKYNFDDNANKELTVGAKVQLWELGSDGTPVTQLPINGELTYTTTAETIELYGLTVGKTYRFIEVEQPEGYLMPRGHEQYVDFTVADDNATHTHELLNEKIPQLRSQSITAEKIKEIPYKDEVVINDHFWAWDLLPNKAYTFKNIALRDETGAVVATTDDVSFTTDGVQTEYDVVFNFNRNALSKSGVYTVTGDLHRDDRPEVTKVQTHYDLTDWNESHTVVEIGTFAFDNKKEETGEAAQFIMNDEAGVIRDRIDYESAIAGSEYIVVTKIVNESEEEVATNKTTITIPGADTPTVSGSAYVNVEISEEVVRANNGNTLVVYEYIYVKNPDGEEILIAQHEDFSDVKQQVQIPRVVTSASETVVTNEENEEDYWFEVTDIVTYDHVPYNTDMIGTATVMNPETKEALVDENGNTFTAEVKFNSGTAGRGTYEVTIKIPYALVEGKDIVMFEGIKTETGVDIAHHYEWEDQDQKVEFPEIHTTAWAVNRKEDDAQWKYNTRNIPEGTEIIDIIDIIEVSNVVAGEVYTLAGKVELIQANGEVITIAINDGEMKKVEEGQTSYELTMDFKNCIVAGLKDEGTKVVVTEELYKDGKLIGKHYQLIDEKQTLREPKVGTTASDKADGDKYIYNTGKQTITDIFKYTDLMPGVEVNTRAWLVDLEGNDLLDAEGNKIEKVITFTPETPNGEITVEFEVDGKYFEGETITVFEDVEEGKQLIASHHDLSQENQTVYVPKVRTHASYTSEVYVDEETSMQAVDVTDILVYENFPVEELLGRITLVDPETAEVLKDADGKEFTVDYRFTPESTTGEFKVLITVPVEHIREKKFVIFEEVFRLVDENEVPLAEHKDLEDTEQLVRLPEVGTTAVDIVTERHDGWANAKTVTMVDTVELKDVKPNHTYTVVARLADVKASTEDEVVFIDIEPVEYVFTTPESEEKFIDYEVKVNIEVPVIFVSDNSTVVFETLVDNGVELALHHDLTDEDQTVEYKKPEIGTTATDEVTNAHIGYRNDNVIKIVDVVKMKGLLPNYTYTLKAQVADKTASTEEEVVLLEDINPEFTFTTPEDLSVDEEYEHTVVIEIPVDKVVVKNEYVVFESLYDEDIELAVHADLEDESQTVTYENPEIGTKAELANTEEDVKNGMTTIKDTVEYKNLKPGREYTLRAKAYNPDTKEFAKDAEGNEYVFTKTFTPEEMNGEVVVDLTMKQLDVNGMKLVVFEKLFVDYGTETEYEVAEHEDETDESQTVKLPTEVKLTIVKKAAGVEQYKLKGAEITIYNSKGEVIHTKYYDEKIHKEDEHLAIGVTDENGEVVFEIFTEEGETYYALETKAPAGYHSNPDKFELKRDENGNLTAEMSIEILDNIIIIPPVKTGDSNNILLWSSLLLGAMALAAGTLVIKRKKAQR